MAQAQERFAQQNLATALVEALHSLRDPEVMKAQLGFHNGIFVGGSEVSMSRYDGITMIADLTFSELTDEKLTTQYEMREDDSNSPYGNISHENVEAYIDWFANTSSNPELIKVSP